MHKFTVEDAAGLTVGSGEIMALTTEQLATRAHRVEMLDEKPSKLTAVRVIQPLQFKAGELLHLARPPKTPGGGEPAAARPPAAPPAPKREKRDQNGDTPEMAQLRGELLKATAEQLTTAKAEGVKAGRLAMLEEIKARNAVIDQAEAAGAAVIKAKQALDGEQDPEKRKSLQKALDAALEAEESANKAVDALPAIEG